MSKRIGTVCRGVEVTVFAGGVARGPCIQLTDAGGFVQFREADAVIVKCSGCARLLGLVLLGDAVIGDDRAVPSDLFDVQCGSCRAEVSDA